LAFFFHLFILILSDFFLLVFLFITEHSSGLSFSIWIWCCFALTLWCFVFDLLHVSSGDGKGWACFFWKSGLIFYFLQLRVHDFCIKWAFFFLL